MTYVFQLRDEYSDVWFCDYETAKRRFKTIRSPLYNGVWYGDLGTNDLNEIYEILNVYRPSDYVGHSLSVSDVVVIIENGTLSAWYVDDIGFEEISADEFVLGLNTLFTADDVGRILRTVVDYERRKC